MKYSKKRKILYITKEEVKSIDITAASETTKAAEKNVEGATTSKVEKDLAAGQRTKYFLQEERSFHFFTHEEKVGICCSWNWAKNS